MKHFGKSLVRYTVMKLLVTVDRSEKEPKDISYFGLSHDDYEELSINKCLILQKRVVQLWIKKEGNMINFAIYKLLFKLCCIQTTLLQPILRQTFPGTVFLTVLCLPGVGIRKNC
jgi:hypothetical protein